MSFFDTKLMGDLMQRMGDHSRVNSFLTQQTLSIVFSLFTFVVFSIVLLSYNCYLAISCSAACFMAVGLRYF